jgi:hypothetical protein
MRLDRLVRGIAVIALLGLPAAAHAQLFRAYLSLSGNDANPCTLPQPCRLLPAALAAVADGGESWMLTSANYNSATVNIDKSVSILAEPGAIGSVVATGGPAIAITGPGIKVMLTNLVIVPLPGSEGFDGVTLSLAMAGVLVVDKVSFSRVNNGVSVTTGATVRVSNSSFVDMGNAGVVLSGGATGEVSNVKMTRLGQFGVQVASSSGITKATITDSTFSGVSNCGIFSFATGGTAHAYATRVTVTGSSGGVCSQGGTSALVSLNQCTLQGNTYGAFVTSSGSVIATSGNNVISNNGANVAGAGGLTPVALQ